MREAVIVSTESTPIARVFNSALLHASRRLARHGVGPDDRAPVLLGTDGPIEHPHGMTGARPVGHGLLQAKRRCVCAVVVAMCVGGGLDAARLFEVV